MNRMQRQPEDFIQVPMAPGAVIRGAIVGMRSHWVKRATASGAVGMCIYSPVDAGLSTTP